LAISWLFTNKVLCDKRIAIHLVQDAGALTTDACISEDVVGSVERERGRKDEQTGNDH
jgi:hypothetical protein